MCFLELVGFLMDFRNKTFRARYPERDGRGILVSMDLDAMFRHPLFEEFKGGVVTMDGVKAKGCPSFNLSFCSPTMQFGGGAWSSFCVQKSWYF